MLAPPYVAKKVDGKVRYIYAGIIEKMLKIKNRNKEEINKIE